LKKTTKMDSGSRVIFRRNMAPGISNTPVKGADQEIYQVPRVQRSSAKVHTQFDPYKPDETQTE
jgi:hypothetical protein